MLSSLPVISIGNLSMGGSGKTPVTQYIIRSLQDTITPLLLSRGYGRRNSRATTIVALPGPIPSVEIIGDEPTLHCQTITKGTVVVTNYRADFLKEHDSDFPGSVVFLDDGFQHYALHRDMDIVIVDDNTARDHYLIPAGVLREPPEQLARADVILCTSVNAGKFAKQWGRPNVPILRISNAKPYVTLHSGSEQPLSKSELENKRFALVTGIANPDRVINTAKHYGLTIVTHIAYHDHYPFSKDDLKKIATESQRSQANALLTTTKDITRLSGLLQPEDQVFVIHQPIQIENPKILLGMIMDTIRLKTTK